VVTNILGTCFLEISILAPPALDVEAVDIVTILGNLLDNALDAVAKVADKVIRLNVEHRKGSPLYLTSTLQGYFVTNCTN
jgi:sensor histidine kinase regulating citrate/malate metabolism